MEITLTLAENGQAAVECDGAASHRFALADLPPLEDPAGYGQALFAALFPPGSPAAAAYARRPERGSGEILFLYHLKNSR